MNHYSLGGKKYPVSFDNSKMNALIDAFYRLHPGLHKHIKPGYDYVGTVANKHLAEMLLENVLEYNKNGFFGDLSEVKDHAEREKISLLADVYNNGTFMMFPTSSPEFDRKFPVGSPEFDRKKNKKGKNKKGKN